MELGLLSNIDYISAVSGGAWLTSTFIYAPFAPPQMLGAYKAPGKLNETEWQSEPRFPLLASLLHMSVSDEISKRKGRSHCIILHVYSLILATRCACGDARQAVGQLHWRLCPSTLQFVRQCRAKVSALAASWIRSALHQPRAAPH